MKRIRKAIDDSINLIEAALPYMPSHMHSDQAVPLLKELRGIAFDIQMKTYKSKKKNRIVDELDTVPQEFLE